jgi:hypothetical protein
VYKAAAWGMVGEQPVGDSRQMGFLHQFKLTSFWLQSMNNHKTVWSSASSNVQQKCMPETQILMCVTGFS